MEASDEENATPATTPAKSVGHRSVCSMMSEDEGFFAAREDSSTDEDDNAAQESVLETPSAPTPPHSKLIATGSAATMSPIPLRDLTPQKAAGFVANAIVTSCMGTSMTPASPGRAASATASNIVCDLISSGLHAAQRNILSDRVDALSRELEAERVGVADLEIAIECEREAGSRRDAARVEAEAALDSRGKELAAAILGAEQARKAADASRAEVAALMQRMSSLESQLASKSELVEVLSRQKSDADEAASSLRASLAEAQVEAASARAEATAAVQSSASDVRLLQEELESGIQLEKSLRDKISTLSTDLVAALDLVSGFEAEKKEAIALAMEATDRADAAEAKLEAGASKAAGGGEGRG